MLRHGRIRMGHKCGASCYRKQGRRKECPWCNRAKARAADKRRWRREFEQMPKSRHWELKGSRHLYKLGLTPEIIMEVQESPEQSIESGWKGRNQAFYKYYPPTSPEAKKSDGTVGGAWFRVVLDENRHLHTAFRDEKTETKGGLEWHPTPATKANTRSSR